MHQHRHTEYLTVNQSKLTHKKIVPRQSVHPPQSQPRVIAKLANLRSLRKIRRSVQRHFAFTGLTVIERIREPVTPDRQPG